MTIRITVSAQAYSEILGMLRAEGLPVPRYGDPIDVTNVEISMRKATVRRSNPYAAMADE